jgi:hypothetical protein
VGDSHSFILDLGKIRTRIAGLPPLPHSPENCIVAFNILKIKEISGVNSKKAKKSLPPLAAEKTIDPSGDPYTT